MCFTHCEEGTWLLYYALDVLAPLAKFWLSLVWTGSAYFSVLYSAGISVPELVWTSTGSACFSVLSSIGLSVPGLMWLKSGCGANPNSLFSQATVQLNPLKEKLWRRKNLGKGVLKVMSPSSLFVISFKCKDKTMNIGWKGKVDQLVHSAESEVEPVKD